MRVTEIRIAGFGGQGVILSAIVLGKAASIYQNVIWVNNKDAAMHQHLGFALERQGKTQEAIRCYRTALALDPNNLPARWRLNRLVPPRTHPPTHRDILIAEGE